ncbi:UNVERIFIED_CONTAM: hypothetical protein K2H54_029450 [Gekko kuhli]
MAWVQRKVRSRALPALRAMVASASYNGGSGFGGAELGATSSSLRGGQLPEEAASLAEQQHEELITSGGAFEGKKGGKRDRCRGEGGDNASEERGFGTTTEQMLDSDWAYRD